MMVQTASAGQPHFILTMAEHTEFCGQLARAFGNDEFESVQPNPEAIFAVENHDRGWDAYDAQPKLDPETGLPFSLVGTPPVDSSKTITASPDFNERYHPYCGLLVSMHMWGLHNRRLGFSQFVVRQRTSTSIETQELFKPEVRARLASEQARQERIKSELAADGNARAWFSQARLLQNYKQLQFFDTLALYFHLRQASERGEEVYIHVPKNAEVDATITVQRVDDDNYTLDLYPFASDVVKVVCRGRYMQPATGSAVPADLGAALRSMPADRQTYTLRPGK
jgi:hypothetical protein